MAEVSRESRCYDRGTRERDLFVRLVRVGPVIDTTNRSGNQHMPSYRHFSVEPKGNVVVVQLLDPKLADSLMVTELQDELLEMIDLENPTNVLVSFNGVSQCSTAVINGLLRAKKRLMAEGGQIKLCCMNEMIRDAYRMLNLDGTVFRIYNSLDEALDAF